MSAEMPKMPEPVAYIAAVKAQRLGQKIPMMTTLTVHRAFSDDVMLFTADQMRTFAQEAARQAMERCAEVCEWQGGTMSMFARTSDARIDAGAIKRCASAIRALIPHDTEKRHG